MRHFKNVLKWTNEAIKTFEPVDGFFSCFVARKATDVDFAFYA